LPGCDRSCGGRIQVFIGSVTGTQPQIAAGRIRALATGHPKRLRNMPELATVAESVPGFSNDGWYGIVAPAGTPAPVIRKLNAEMKRALANPEFSKHVESLGMEPTTGSTPEELREWTQRACALEESGTRCGHPGAGELRTFTLRQAQGERKASGFPPPA
jgi:tripartite-type tricarboxylate transporter receptor subunit TctC